MTRKIAGRSRTKHQVYELQDTHPLVQQLDKRDQNDKNPYLFVVWPPVEESSGSQEEETLFGTFLVPCRTATRGSFPLDGTYFQINEVFADDDTSKNPIRVRRKLLLSLTTNTLYCGTSISNISEGISYEETQECFLKGYVCIRGFNMKTREPTSLHCRFHQPLTQTKTVKPNSKPRKGTKNKGTDK
ncbi:putative demeter, domain-containing protein [Helianthus annuus]|nr:putative demeter, domain-containing protein [Helianthus annuus]